MTTPKKSLFKSIIRPLIALGLVLTLALGHADGALAARSGGRIGGGSFRAPSRTYSPPSRTYSPGGGGYYPGGGGGYYPGGGGGFFPSSTSHSLEALVGLAVCSPCLSSSRSRAS